MKRYIKCKIQVGDKFGRLTVVEVEPFTQEKTHRRYALVQCNCGSPPKRVNVSFLTNGATQSCGCLQRLATSNFNYDRWERDPRNDRVGQVQGWLTVVRRDYGNVKGSNIRWICRCRCGREISIPSYQLNGISGSRTTYSCRPCRGLAESEFGTGIK